MNVYKGYYFTGDGAMRDGDGYWWIRGRVDGKFKWGGGSQFLPSFVLVQPERDLDFFIPFLFGGWWMLYTYLDVINVSGHRLSTAEIEAALVSHESCAEAAVVGVFDDLTG